MNLLPHGEENMADRHALLCGLALAALATPDASAQDGYKKPPADVLKILNAPAAPAVSVSPTNSHLLLIQSDRYPPIADLAEPMLRLAGLRINPATNGPARGSRITELTIIALANNKKTTIALPNGKIGHVRWSPDGRHFAFTETTDKGIALWIADVETGKTADVPYVRLNAAIGSPYQWMPDNKSLLVQMIPEKRGNPPEVPKAPKGPVIQESDGKAAPVRTYQDLLQNAHDEALFSYYCKSQLAIVDSAGVVAPLGKPAIITDSDPSPGGDYILVERITAPFSYLHPYYLFPHDVQVWDRQGNAVATIAEIPLQDKVPIEGVPTGPRDVRWIPTLPHSLMWVEAQDEGNPKKKVEHRDALFAFSIGTDRGADLLMKLEHRFNGANFLPVGNRMLVRDYDREKKWARTFLASTTALLGEEPRLIFERSIQDRYGDPGRPLSRMLPSGHSVLRTAGDAAGDTLWLSGPGASPKGDRPFLDRFDLKTGKSERIFQSPDDAYEDVVAILNAKGTKLLVRHESTTEPPNYLIRDGEHEKAITTFEDPAPELRKIKKKIVTTKRPDGTVVSFTLYTPPGHAEGEKLPTVFSAYPREFATADTAGQVSGSPHRFTLIDGYSHMFFLAQGYAVMEVAMPIVGPPETANDTFIEQLVANAKAAIDKGEELGVVDRTRVGVMGHSYGAFMTANLLAHSDLFKAGIGRSGAYNRTLTPFGFQNERRTFWEAPQVYGKMSPFYHADKIKEPLLLIHGEADNNPGTFPVQSERMYQAIRGTGGTCRLVLLPHESHGYQARESIEHVLAEQIAWFDKYVKNGKK
jgi:dipeptidyl aminopeptidase/acylaminoacyl peptidase